MNHIHPKRYLLPVALFACLMLALAAVACTEADTDDCPDGTENWVEHRLFMGRSAQAVEVATFPLNSVPKAPGRPRPSTTSR